MKTKLKVGALDAGMVFRADGKVEALIPRLPEGREVPENVLAAEALLWAYTDASMFEEIVRRIERDEEQRRH